VEELAALHMPQARFEAKLELLAEEQLGPRGLNRVEFLFSANPGEPLAPLTQVASGGELSRVLLAIKGVLATGDEVATYVFDEVDAGVGGSVAQAIGQRLHLASHSHQVLCITHLPQIAAFADAHYRVDKLTQRGRTITRVVQLSEDDRVEELARMLGGAKVTESARQHARELIEQARSGVPQPAPAVRSKRKRSSARARGRG
jgi:DNA repair protein RecN (Recombination protein N)